MALKHVMINDIISEQTERMQNLKKYYPFFALCNTVFLQYKEGKYDYLDMGYITLASLRFFINENNFHEKDVTYEEYEEFLLELLHRDFSLNEKKSEEKALALHIFDKLQNSGKAFEFKYFDPDTKSKKTARTRLIESRIENGRVYYRVTADAIEFYLDTKEIKDESRINIQQLLLEKMIKSDNFKGGIEVVKRINSEVLKLRKEKEAIVKLMSVDIFEGVRAYEEYMKKTAGWFSEEQKMFEKNKALVDKAAHQAAADMTGNSESYHAAGREMTAARKKTGRRSAFDEISELETELKKAITAHGELIRDTAELSQVSERIITGAKYKSLRNVFDFNYALRRIYAKDSPGLMGHIIKPFCAPKLKKSFSIRSIDNILTLKTDDRMTGEKIIRGEVDPDFRYDDDLLDEQTGKNFALIFSELLERLKRWEKLTLKEFNAILEIKFGEEIFSNRDFYSFLVHLAGKRIYDMERMMTRQDTIMEELLVKYMPEDDKEKYAGMVFEVRFDNNERIAIHDNNNEYITDMIFERRYENG